MNADIDPRDDPLVIEGCICVDNRPLLPPCCLCKHGDMVFACGEAYDNKALANKPCVCCYLVQLEERIELLLKRCEAAEAAALSLQDALTTLFAVTREDREGAG